MLSLKVLWILEFLVIFSFFSVIWAFPLLLFSFFKVFYFPQVLVQIPVPPEVISDFLKPGNCSITLRILHGTLYFWFLAPIILCAYPILAMFKHSSNTRFLSCAFSVSLKMSLLVCNIIWDCKLCNNRTLFFLIIPFPVPFTLLETLLELNKHFFFLNKRVNK